MTTLDNDLKFMGQSTHPGGQFRDIAVVGQVRVGGDVTCRSFSCMGEATVRGALASARTSIMGQTTVDGAVDAGDFNVMGQVECRSTLRVRALNCMGKLKVMGRMDAERVKLFGELTVAGDCNVDEFESRGGFVIQGLLSVDNLQVQPYHLCSVGEIGGARIEVRRRWGFLDRVPGVSWLRDQVIGNSGYRLETHTIEGDEIRLEDTTADVVRGGRILIGRGCRIGSVEYRDAYRCEGDAAVGAARQV